MVYRLEKAHDSGMRITKKESGEVVKKKSYSTHMVNRLAIPPHKTMPKTAFDTGLTPVQEGEFEELLGYDKGYLNNKSPFWLSYGIKIPAIGLVLNDEIPEDALKIAIIKGRVKTVGDIALNKKDLKTNADAKWILSNEEAEAEVVADNITWIAKASQKFDSMSLEDMENYLKAQSVDSRGMSSKIVRGKVAADVMSSPKKFLMIANDKHMETKIFIHELVAYGIIQMNKANYIYDEATVAYSQGDMLEYVTNKANAKVILNWKKQLEESKK